MTRAAELRGQGLTMRAIAAELGVSVGTVHADLKRWDADHANVVSLRSDAAFKTAPGGAKLNTPVERGDDAEIITLRRSS
ncbi:MAG TPA: hypothetical protein VIR33_12250 [Thermopolyspora sp.]|jgi:hypothetical protein